MLFFYMNPILITAAVVPAIVLLVKVYKADKLENATDTFVIFGDVWDYRHRISWLCRTVWKFYIEVPISTK